MTIEISVVVLNFNGKEYLDDCIRSVLEQDFPSDQLELIVVDNGSSDGSIQHVRQHWPQVRLIENGRNLGFAAGNNKGVEAARGRYIALLNNDARADKAWVKHALAPLRRSRDIGMVASKILDFSGERIDYAGGGLSYYGHGYKIGVGEQDHPRFDKPRDTLFGSGCAFFMPRDLYLEVGGLDDDFFAFFEDVDLGWRLWVLGYRVLYQPTSLVYHRHHGTAEKLGHERERFLLERNALMMIIKNYDDTNLAKSLPASLLLALERGLTYSDVGTQKYDLAKGTKDWTGEDEQVSALTTAHILALSEVAHRLPETLKKRAKIQTRRQRSDREILSLFQLPLRPNINHPRFLEAFEAVTDSSGIEAEFVRAAKVLIITGDTVSAKMAGPAIRAWEMSKHLSKRHEVRLLAARLESGISSDDFVLEALSRATLRAHLQWADVVLFQGFILHHYPELGEAGKILIADIYDPFHLENLEMFREDATEKRFNVAETDLDVINDQLKLCDFFICASEKQRDFWLGQLAALGRLNPATYDQDPTMRSFVEVVPFGMPSEPPMHNNRVLKGVFPGIQENDKILLWGGGIYNWFDPLTVIRAVDLLKDEHPEVKLFFLGLAHPNPDVPEMHMATEARALARQLELEGTNVFFNTQWVPYEERSNYLMECDIGISCHLEHIETTYSYRTRVLDYFWAELPSVVTKGDALGDLVEERNLGLTVAPGDVDGFALAIKRLIEDEDLAREIRLNIGKLKADLTWEGVLRPLDEFCANPRKAPDNLALRPLSSPAGRQFLRLLRRAIHYWRNGGIGAVQVQARHYLKRRLSTPR